MTPIRKISGRLNDAAVSVESVTVFLQVDSIPKCVVQVAESTGQTVREMLSADVLGKMRERQVRRLAGVEQPDATLTLEDGQGNTIAFNGYFVAPAMSLQGDGRASQIAIAGVDSAINGLDMSIYLGRKVFNNFDATRMEAEAPSLSSGSVTGILNNLSGALLETLDAAISEEADETSREIVRLTHRNNVIGLKLWRSILNAQEVKYEALTELLNGPFAPVVKREMVYSLTQIMQSKVSGFWSTLTTIMEHFKLCYIPSTSGSGKFQRRDEKVLREPTKEIVVSATAVGFNDGSDAILQLGGVVMMAPGSDFATRAEAAKSAAVSAAYPATFDKGYVHREPAPQWMVDPVYLSKPGDTAAGGMVYDLDQCAADTAAGEKEHVKVNAQYSAVLNEMCRVVYDDLQLASSSASVTLPLQTDIDVGERVRFVLREGGSFTGFLSAVTHTMQVTGDSLNAEKARVAGVVDFRTLRNVDLLNNLFIPAAPQ